MAFFDFIPRGGTSPATISYRTMRTLVGSFALSLPALLFLSALWLPGHAVLETISAYYHSCMRDAMVGILCAVSLFLFSYKGYDWRDFWSAKVASLAALGVAFFPALFMGPIPSWIPQPIASGPVRNFIHTASAFVFFLDIGLMSLCVFTRTHAPSSGRKPSREKLRRNSIYAACGIVILASLALMVCNSFLFYLGGVFIPHAGIALETVGLAAFGFSWLVKGESLPFLRDK